MKPDARARLTRIAKVGHAATPDRLSWRQLPAWERIDYLDDALTVVTGGTVHWFDEAAAQAFTEAVREEAALAQSKEPHAR